MSVDGVCRTSSKIRRLGQGRFCRSNQITLFDDDDDLNHGCRPHRIAGPIQKEVFWSTRQHEEPTTTAIKGFGTPYTTRRLVRSIDRREKPLVSRSNSPASSPYLFAGDHTHLPLHQTGAAVPSSSSINTRPSQQDDDEVVKDFKPVPPMAKSPRNTRTKSPSLIVATTMEMLEEGGRRG
jgi:hypothetical protein